MNSPTTFRAIRSGGGGDSDGIGSKGHFWTGVPFGGFDMTLSAKMDRQKANGGGGGN